MERANSITREQFIETRGLSRRVAEQSEGKKNYNIDLAMTALLGKGKISAEQYTEYFRKFVISSGDLNNQLFLYKMPKKEVREKI